MGQIAIGPGSIAGGSGTARVRLQLLVTNNQFNALDMELDELFNAYSICMMEQKDLASGFNEINVPPSLTVHKAGGVIIRPPDNNNAAITLKGVTGDTGVSLSLVGLQMLVFPVTPPANFGLTLATAKEGFRFYWF